MQFSVIASVFALLAIANGAALDARHHKAAKQGGGAKHGSGAVVGTGGRPIANGACCIPATSKKEDVCTVNGEAGKCVPADTANCGGALTCIPNNKLKCNDKVLENGLPTCRLA